MHKLHQTIPSMETRRKNPSFGDTFSFPNTPCHEKQDYSGDDDFEFGSCFTPASSNSCKDSPADHLFFNGKLLPHAFPFQPNNNGTMRLLDVVHSNRTSLTSSIGGKDSLSSLMSSRSNSTNSRSSATSSCTSARTSSSDNSSQRKLIYHYHHHCFDKTTPFRSSEMYKAGSGDWYSSRRWQFITPVPTLSREASVNKKKKVETKKPNKARKKKRKVKKVVSRRRRICRRLFRWLVSACVKFHAMEPSKGIDVVDHVKDG